MYHEVGALRINLEHTTHTAQHRLLPYGGTTAVVRVHGYTVRGSTSNIVLLLLLLFLSLLMLLLPLLLASVS
jgi:hypothetical protein